MSRVPKKVTNWLYTVIQPQYVHKNLVYTDTVRFLDSYLSRGFKIRTSIYVSSNGTSELLLCVSGSVETTNGPVPITMWIPLNYPYSDPNSGRAEANGTPLIFVDPSQHQSICTGNYIDAQGRFYHPFLSQWFTSSKGPSFSSEFNLLHLMDCVQSAFSREFPLREITLGPSMPPKSHYPETSLPTSPRRQMNGPPLPKKSETQTQSDQNSIPARYRSPPPLPGQGPTVTRSAHASPTLTKRNSFEEVQRAKNGSHGYEPRNDYTQGQKERRVSLNRLGNDGKTTSNPKQANSTVEDLMDKMTLESEKSAPDEDAFNRLSEQIERVLNGDEGSSINLIIGRCDQILKDMEPLAQHINHHNNQAKANSENLEKHIDYLKERVEMIKSFNETLGHLKEYNQSTVEEVRVDSTRSIHMDDIIIPDLALVNQLYETITEIKAIKDCIRLIEGSYQSEPELISDVTLDSCVKSVRAMSRDLFWLELTKQQVSEKMGLQI